MSSILLGAMVAVVALPIGFVIGAVFGMKYAHKQLEREGRLKPVTPPAVAKQE